MESDKKILIVDDDREHRRSLAEQLRLHEFVVVERDCGTFALEVARHERFDAIFVELCLPDIDGREVCRRMRRRGFTAPIIMVTTAADDADVILGLAAGANDYVVKPYSLGVLMARVGAQMRQFAQSEGAVYVVGPYRFRPSEKLMLEAETGRQVRLTEKETAALKYLRRADGKVVPREVLLTKIWGYNTRVSTHTLETHVYRLRKKIEPDPANPTILITEPGGYRVIP